MPKNKNGYIIKKLGSGFYRPHAQGYTTNLSEAGRFSYVDSVIYSYPNGKLGPRDGISFKHESKHNASEDIKKGIEIESMNDTIDLLFDVKEQLSVDLAKALVEIDELKREIAAMQWSNDEAFADTFDI